jgi:hypothetical protein
MYRSAEAPRANTSRVSERCQKVVMLSAHGLTSLSGPVGESCYLLDEPFDTGADIGEADTCPTECSVQGETPVCQ